MTTPFQPRLRDLRILFILLLPTAFLLPQAIGQLQLTVEEASADILTFTLSGSFEEDSVGDEHFLAVKSNWSGTKGVNNDWIFGKHAYLENSITFFETTATGVVATQSIAGVVYKSETFGDAIYFTKGTDSLTPFKAGTEVFGTFTMAGSNLFDPQKLGELQLVAGLSHGSSSGTTGSGESAQWNRLEADADYTAIPEPTTLGIGGLALLGIFFGLRAVRSRRKS